MRLRLRHPQHISVARLRYVTQRGGQVMRQSRVVLRSPWTKRVTALVGVLALLASFLLQTPVHASNLTKVVTTQADFQAGTNTNVDTESVPDSVQLSASGSWSSNFFTARAPVGLGGGSNSVSDGTNVYVIAGGGTPLFYRYSPVTESWTPLANAPFIANISTAMTYDGNGTIYAVLSNFSNHFAKYTIATNTWTILGNTPVNTGYGAGLAYDGTYFYLIAGWETQNFWRYDPIANTWTSLVGPPGTIGNGGGLAYYSGNLYTWRGLQTATGYSYNISTGVWTTLTNAPGIIGTVNINDIGTNSAVVVGGSIYKFAGNASTALYKYNVSGNSWSSFTGPVSMYSRCI